MALMFFADRPAAVSEMARVVAGAAARSPLLVPSALDNQAAFRPFVELAARHRRTEAMSLLSAYFVCGDLDELTALFEAAGLRVTVARIGRRHLHGAVGRRRRDDGGREHAARRADQCSDLPPAPRGGGGGPGAVHDAQTGSLVAPFECLIVAATR